MSLLAELVYMFNLLSAGCFWVLGLLAFLVLFQGPHGIALVKELLDIIYMGMEFSPFENGRSPFFHLLKNVSYFSIATW